MLDTPARRLLMIFLVTDILNFVARVDQDVLKMYHPAVPNALNDYNESDIACYNSPLPSSGL